MIHKGKSSPLITMEELSLNQTITFAVNTKYNEEILETFTFEQLGLDHHMDKDDLHKEINRIFESWVSFKLNISFSIVYDIVQQ